MGIQRNKPVNESRYFIRVGFVFLIMACLIGSVVFTFSKYDPKLDVSITYEDVFTGKGMKNDPYLISSTEDFAKFRDIVNEGEPFYSTFFLQTTDIDLAAYENWLPIGQSETVGFAGTYNGGGHSILHLNCKSEDDCALFGCLNGTILNLGIDNGLLEGNSPAAFVQSAGKDSVIANCFNNATVRGEVRASGIVDDGQAHVLFCINTGAIDSNKNSFGISSGDCRSIVSCKAVDAEIAGERFSGEIVDSEQIDFESLAASIDRLYSIPPLHDDGKSTIASLSSIELDDFIPLSCVEGRVAFSDPPANSSLRSTLASSAAVIMLPILTLFLTGAILLSRLQRNKKHHSTRDADVCVKTSPPSSRVVSPARKGTVSAIASVVLFAIAFIPAALLSNGVLMDNVAVKPTQSYYEQPQGKTDVLIVGTSGVGMNLDTEELWTDFGISSYTLWAPSQPYWNSLYSLQEALKQTDPKIVVLDATSSKYAFEHSFVLGETNYPFLNTAGLQLSGNKIKAIQVAASQENWLDLFLGFPAYHSRYGTLTEADFEGPDTLTGANYKGGSIRYMSKTPERSDVDQPATKPIQLQEISYLQRIVAVCREHNIPVLIVASPYPDASEVEPYYESLRTIASSLEVDFIDYNYLSDDPAFNSECFWTDGVHLNTRGARAVSAQLGNYLLDAYSLQDHRNDEGYESWGIYAHAMQNDYMRLISLPRLYLSELSRDNRAVLLMCNNVRFTDQKLFTLKRTASLSGLDFSGIGIGHDSGCWIIENTSSGEKPSRLDSDYGTLETHYFGLDITAQLGQIAKLTIDDTEYTIPEESVVCVVFDSATEKVVDVCCLTQEAGLVAHWALP